MLGYALANDRDFTASASLWRNDGDILKLLRKKSDPDTLSVLDSRGFYQTRLEAAYDQMPPYPAEKKANAIPSSVEELDVFVTGTDVHGRIFTEFDDDGHPIDVKDHRQVFLLSYREGRKNEFDRLKPGTAEALAKLSRITSCFPVAFEPVRLPDPRDNKDADELLKRWGALPPNHAAYFLDGGLLDNKPFSYTITQIVHRTATRPVHRMLFYVEPDPEKFVDTVPSDAPNVMQSALDALVNIPGYQSIASDLQNIAEHNDRASTSRGILKSAKRWATTEFTGATAAPARDSKFLAEAAGVGGLSLIRDQGRRAQYLRCRINQISSRGLEGILKKNGQLMRLEGPGERHAAKVLVRSFNHLLNPDDEQAENAQGVLLRFDVYFRLRRLFFLAGEVQKPTQAGSRVDEDLILGINHHIKLLEMVQYAMEKLADDAPISWDDLKDCSDKDETAANHKWRLLQNYLAKLLQPGLLPDFISKDTDANETKAALAAPGTYEQKLKKQRADFMRKIQSRAKSCLPEAALDDSPGELLLQKLDEQEQRMLKENQIGTDNWLQLYSIFPIVDSYKFPLEYMSGMETDQTIHTVRISPIDAKRAFSNRSLDDKICGNELAHFGGFLKSSWRANDIMWGRLDGVCQLIECLVTRDQIKKAFADSEADKKEAFFSFNTETLHTYFPHSPQAELGKLSDEIEKLRKIVLVDPDDPAAFEPFWDLLTRIAQREILKEEVPLVMESAIQQHQVWNEYPYAKKKSLHADSSADLMRMAPIVWKMGIKQMDAAVTAYAAEQIVTHAEPAEGWDGFFEKNYRVGEENLQSGVPKPVILELVAQGALRLRESAVTIAGKQEAAIRKSKPFRLLLKWPIDAGYAFFRAQRTAPEWKSQINTGLIVAAMAMLIVDAFLFPTLPKSYIKDHLRIALLVGALPAIILVAIIAFLAWWKRPVSASRDERVCRFHLRAALPDSWAATLQNLPSNLGASLFHHLIGQLEGSGLTVDMEQMGKTNAYEVLRGEAELVVRGWKSIRAAKGFSSIEVAVTVTIGDQQQPRRFTITERIGWKINRIVTNKGYFKLRLVAQDKTWKTEVTRLGFAEALAVLNSVFFMLENSGLVVEVTRLSQGEKMEFLKGNREIVAWRAESAESTNTIRIVPTVPDGWSFILTDRPMRGGQQ
jgi:patatin-related protein